MQKRYWDFSEIDSTELMNTVIRSILRDHDVGSSSSSAKRPGRLTGFITTANSPADDKVNLERDGSMDQIVVTEVGTVVVETDDLDDVVTFDVVESNPRIDLVAIKHEYRDTLPNLAARYVIVKGTAAASPTPPYSGLQPDETPLSEVWIDTAPGIGNLPDISDNHIRILPTTFGMLVSDSEKTWGKTNNADGNAGIWSRFGRNDDRFYMLRNPENDEEVFLVLNAYFNPVDGKWYQEDVTRRSVLILLADDSAIDASLFLVYKADAGTSGAVFATFWTKLLDLDETGFLDFENNLSDFSVKIILDDSPSTLRSSGSAEFPAIAKTDQDYIGVVYNRDGGLYYKRAAPGTTSFSSEFTVTSSTGSPRFPDLVSLGSEKLLASYMKNTNDKTRVRKSTDGGQTWGSAITVYSTGISANRSGLTVVSSSKIFCAFVTIEDATDSIKLLESTDEGATWVNKQLVYAGGGPTLRDPVLLATPSDRLVCSFADTTNTIVKSMYSDDGGASWSTPITVESGITQPRSIQLFYEATQDVVYAIYVDSDDIYMKKSFDGAGSWNAREFLWGNDTDIQYPDMELSRTGNLFLVYSVTDTDDVMYVTGFMPLVVAAK